MARIHVMNWITLDGVMQGPGRPDEDTRGGFSHGGWSIAYTNDEVVAKFGERMTGGHAWLFGRKSYEDLLAAWNRQGGPFKDSLNATHKYVVSRDPTTELAWPNSELLAGDDGAAAVAALKERVDTDLVILGSGVLIGALLAAGLVDEFVLPIAPLVLGEGRRLFPEGVRAPLRLVDCVPTRTGAMVATYVPAPPAEADQRLSVCACHA